MKAEDILSQINPYFEDDLDDSGFYVKSFDDCTIGGGLTVKLTNVDVWYDPNEDIFELTNNGNGKTITQLFGDDVKSLTVDKKRFIVSSSYFDIFCN